ncbi:MAG: methyl-accepting chemotaxis protein, partial [Chloroflexota bacterium]|nr:methyl-accepting chemotaxis protein [Chloroflexota bacterium]
EEVRALAQRSAAAAKTTADLIEQSVTSASGGVALNGEVSRHLAAINDQINRVGQVLGDVATASERQSRGIGQINGAITQLGQLTQGNAANAEESAAAAAELSGQSAQMQALVGAYQLTDDYDARDVDARPALDTPAAPQHGPRRRPSGDPATRHASASLVGATAAPALLR